MALIYNIKNAIGLASGRVTSGLFGSPVKAPVSVGPIVDHFNGVQQVFPYPTHGNARYIPATPHPYLKSQGIYNG